jgi:UDP:flavonoid glycosyltransferase YjiC (YdhE family)
VQALRTGVAQVVLPLFADQPYNAARVDELGAGVRVAGPDGIGDAVTRVLDGPGVRARAAEVAADAAADPPAAQAAEALLDAALGVV